MIKPFNKKGDKLEVINYRPVSLISNLARVVEKDLKIRIETLLKTYHIILKNYLFILNIFLSDLFDLGAEGDVISFAIIYADDDWKKRKEKFSKIFVWFESSILTVYLEKTFYVPIASYLKYYVFFSRFQSQMGCLR